jgi:hypothetical protein
MAEDMRELVSGKYIEYKGLPLVREGDTICYGDMQGKCILTLDIMSYKKVGDNELPDDIIIQLVDPKDQTKVFRQGQSKGLYEALSLGLVWFEHEMKK